MKKHFIRLAIVIIFVSAPFFIFKLKMGEVFAYVVDDECLGGTCSSGFCTCGGGCNGCPVSNWYGDEICNGGGQSGVVCATDFDCPGGTCEEGDSYCHGSLP